MSERTATRLGIIGGSGLYDMGDLRDLREQRPSTPFGEPSGPLLIGRLPELPELELVFLSRHGAGHRLSPSEVPYRANVFAMKSLGVSWLVSVSAVGSLREDIAPGHMVVIDQFIDRTKGVRPSSFFGGGVVAHASFGDPLCATLRGYLLAAAREVGAAVHDGGTYVCIEGPQFSTRAESLMYRSWGASVIGMTNLTEAKLAREAELSYATLAMCTDYDCWRSADAAIDISELLAVLSANVALGRAIVRATAPRVAAHEGPAPMGAAMAGAVVTDPAHIPPGRIPETGSYLL